MSRLKLVPTLLFVAARKLTFTAIAASAVLLLPTEARTQAPETGLQPDVELTASNGAFEFNGIDQALNLGRSAILNASSGEFTVHAWVNFTSLSEGGPPCFGPGCDISILDKMSSAFVNGDGWRLLKQSDDHFWFCLGGEFGENGCDGGLATTVRSATVTVPGVWYSVAAVRTFSTISIYVNGVLEATTPLGTFTDTNSADLLVGGNAREGAFFNGKVDQVQLFKRALIAGQVRAIFERSRARHLR